MALSQIKNHNKLMNEWKLSNIQDGNALSMIFSGPSGTGKTLTAEALAKELKNKLYIVRYSNLVDSFIGETGKNIVKVFEIAKKNKAILFFDEADAIASSRTNILQREPQRSKPRTVWYRAKQNKSTENGYRYGSLNYPPNWISNNSLSAF